MAEYNRWMNARLYDAAARLPETELFKDRGAFFGSLFDTLNHIAVGDTIWLKRFAQHPDLPWLKDLLNDFPVPTTLRQRLAQLLLELRSFRTKADAVIIQFAARVTEAQLADTLRYANTSGQAQARNFGALVQHFFNHQTHHRGQATTLLFKAGVDIGMTDVMGVIPNET
ncbi:MAG: damage-inducible protein DinB [Betaproteobacteria bacterium]|nr:damage-inducible protein DinB [Betaproteobacteria bacterium]